MQEAREISLSQIQYFTKTTILKCKEVVLIYEVFLEKLIACFRWRLGFLILFSSPLALDFSLSILLQSIRKCHRAINESRAQKRKVTLASHFL